MDIWCVHPTNQFMIKCEANPSNEIMSLKVVFQANKLYYKDSDGIYIIIQDDEDIKALLECPIRILYIGRESINARVNESLLYLSIFGNCSICEKPITCIPETLKCNHKIHPNCLFAGVCMLCSSKCKQCGIIINSQEYGAHIKAHKDMEQLEINKKLEEQRNMELQRKMQMEAIRKLEEEREKERQKKLLLEKQKKEEEERIMLEEQNLCVICLITIEDPDRYFLPCSHRFHKDCITMWLAQSNMCPICRQSPEEMIRNPQFI
jgi:hypothetical protein